MKSMKDISKKNDAVSPVVGVMLMLVVTIIIAAVVAVFASGVVTNQEPAANTVIKLDDYKVGTLSYVGDYTVTPATYTYTPNSFVYKFDKDKGDAGGSVGLYSMTFGHNGGDKLLTKDLTLSITYSGATFEYPVSDVLDDADVHTISAGDKITLSIPTEETDLASYHDGKLFGLGQQDMYMSGYGTPEFTWAIKDGGNNVIAKGSVVVPWW